MLVAMSAASDNLHSSELIAHTGCTFADDHSTRIRYSAILRWQRSRQLTGPATFQD
jgi:hypothetical protein